jgi:hypothetical protein
MDTLVVSARTNTQDNAAGEDGNHDTFHSRCLMLSIPRYEDENHHLRSKHEGEVMRYGCGNDSVDEGEHYNKTC